MDNSSSCLRHGQGSRGFTYVGLLLMVALTGAALAGVGEAWHTAVQRAKEAELLFVGGEFGRAIAAYYDSTPGTGKQFPKTLDDLLYDRRYQTTRRYLRKIYVDPVTGKADWVLIKGPGDTIVGVHSPSEEVPMRRANFPREYGSFNTAGSYAEWRFVYSGPIPPPSAPIAPAAPAAGAKQTIGSPPIPASAVLSEAPPSGPSDAEPLAPGARGRRQE
jgi:type II secretory pathway pseudopilin PulG